MPVFLYIYFIAVISLTSLLSNTLWLLSANLKSKDDKTWKKPDVGMKMGRILKVNPAVNDWNITPPPGGRDVRAQ